MNLLDVKVLRDLWSMRTQALSIALLIASGIAVFVMSVSNYVALVSAMNTHYRNERFADLFASLKRAPLALAEQIRDIDGIAIVEPRIAQTVRVIRPDTDLSITGRIISVPAADQPQLNRLYVVKGRWLDPARPDEVIVNEAYARARAVEPGDAIDVVLNGRLHEFHVAGIALSPEFVFATRPGLPLPDDRNLAVLWAGEDAVAGAFDMKGAFNDVLMTLAPGASKPEVIEAVDRILSPFGGIGAYDRRDLPSNRFLEDELAEQETLGIVMPATFYAIAAFLMNIVVGRLVEAQREQIAALKALGYSNLPIALHYIKFVSVIAIIGAAIGLLLGWWFAASIIENYRAFFRFPVLKTRLELWTIAVAVLASMAAANIGALSAVYRIVRLAPAEALRPQIPKVSTSVFWLGRFSGTAAIPLQFVIALRVIVGHPFRTLFTIVGIALAVPLVLFGLFWFDAIGHMIDVSFGRIERGDAFVMFSTPVRATALHELRSVPGVMLAEGQRIVPVEITTSHRKYRTSLVGLPASSELKVPRDRTLAPIEVPPSGVMMSRPLAESLGISVGQSITIAVLEEKRPVRDLPVVKLSDDILGFSVTMEISALNRLLREDDLINAAALKVDTLYADRVWSRLQMMPRIESSSVKSLWLSLFNESIAGMIVVGAAILTGFGLLIAVGVVYNSARVAFQERAWEVASLRILGFTRRECAVILISELAFEVLVAIPLGLLVGRALIELIVNLRVRESFQVPVVIEPQSYAAAALIILTAAIASGFVVQQRINKLDLVHALKARD